MCILEWRLFSCRGPLLIAPSQCGPDDMLVGFRAAVPLMGEQGRGGKGGRRSLGMAQSRCEPDLRWAPARWEGGFDLPLRPGGRGLRETEGAPGGWGWERPSRPPAAQRERGAGSQIEMWELLNLPGGILKWAFVVCEISCRLLTRSGSLPTCWQWNRFPQCSPVRRIRYWTEVTLRQLTRLLGNRLVVKILVDPLFFWWGGVSLPATLLKQFTSRDNLESWNDSSATWEALACTWNIFPTEVAILFYF